MTTSQCWYTQQVSVFTLLELTVICVSERTIAMHDLVMNAFKLATMNS